MKKRKRKAKSKSFIAKVCKWAAKKTTLVFLLIVSSIAGTCTAILDFVSVTARTEPIWFTVPLYILAVFPVALNIVIVVINCSTRYEYEKITKTEAFSNATLVALKNANDYKRRFILQSTYGNVPEWHPIDYQKNILVYDVHEQIRTILFELQKAIISNVDGLTAQNITVDLAYCYPNKDYLGSIPYPAYTNGNYTDETWKLITSGEHSLSGSMKEYLGRHDSFFYHVDQEGYCFVNDRSTISNAHYVPSNRDKEHNQNGSIVGIEIELRNDAPESVFIKGILTITTFGQKLYDNEVIDETDFKAAFEEQILQPFSSLILSELSQMYIRHALKSGQVCPRTGRKIGSENTCVFTPPDCYHTLFGKNSKCKTAERLRKSKSK